MTDGDDRVIPVPGAAQRHVLAILASNNAKLIGADRLSSLLDCSAGSLRTMVSRLRSNVGADVVVTSPGGYSLVGVDTDIERFNQLVAESHRQDAQSAIDSLDEALASWRGEALAEFSERSWAIPQIARLREARSSASEHRAAAALRAGRSTEAVSAMCELTSQEPLRERSWELLMRALRAEGRVAESLRVFHDFRSYLAREVGIAPSVGLRSLERELLARQENNDVERDEPRTAILTLLVTDIEGSTRLCAEAPDQMHRAVARHDEIVRGFFATTEGRIFSTAGDGFGIAFDSPIDACAAAVTLQARFAEEKWTPETPLKVRMGLHLGLVTVRDGVCTGRPLGVADRVRAAARGGQILLTSSVVDHIEPGAWNLGDLGTHRLHGHDGPVQIYQLDHTGEPTENFGSPRMISRSIGPLPAHPRGRHRPELRSG